MSSTRHEVRPGAYYDSVVLMQLQKALAALPGVEDAGVVMATPANREILTAAGFDVAEVEAGADDMLVVVQAEDVAAAGDALGQVDALLQRRRSTVAAAYQPRSLAAAVRDQPEAAWVLVSVPGQYAAGVAEEALTLGRHVFLYSDNVPLADEVRLKQQARAAGLLLMGPDCGTAIINGIGLGFANRVRRGPVGVVAAAGTGLQAVTTGVHQRGGGISQAIGTGGRDLQEAVGGVTALQAVDLLGRDPDTTVLVLVSKPPAPAVATRLLQAARASGKPVVVSFLGQATPARRLGNLYFATSLDDAAGLAVTLAGSALTAKAPSAAPAAPYLRALFSGGTLAYEALLALQTTLAPLYSNTPLRPDQQLPDPFHSQAHTVLDLGEDVFTQGRLHPMMDNDLRLRRLRQETADPEVGVILLDVVLGEGAHLDPASELAPAVAAARQQRPELAVVVLVVGTDADPQGVDEQTARLAAAGALVCRTTAAAVDLISSRLAPMPTVAEPRVSLNHFGPGLTAVNVGLERFYDSLVGQDAAAVQVAWRPPAGGNEKLMDILARLKTKPAKE